MTSSQSQDIGLFMKNIIFRSGAKKRLLFTCMLIVTSFLICIPTYRSFSPDSHTGQVELEFEAQNNSLSIEFDPLSTFPIIKIDKSCDYIFSSIKSPRPFLLLDQKLLSDILNKKCQKTYGKLTLGIDAKDFRFLSQDDQQKYEILLYENSSNTDYLKIYDNVTRIVPKMPLTSYYPLLIPNDVTRFFEFWRRSKFLECSPKPLRRALQETFFEGTVEGLAKLSRYLVSFNMYPFLNGGTLLGWYRECNVISHTNDVDLAVFIDELNLDFVTQLQEKRLPFNLLRKLGKVNDSFELTVKPRGMETLFMDVFFMYWDSVNEQHWTGALQKEILVKYRYSFPKYEPYCACNLKGHLFWITCSPHEMLTVEYGPNYMYDIPTSKFSWTSSQYNVRKNGYFLEKEREEVYILYDSGILHNYFISVVFVILFVIFA